MQNTLLDILILGLLVLVFGSIYRTRPTLRLRYWIIGWLFVLLHFSVLLLKPSSSFWSNLVGVLIWTGLTVGGVFFLFASTVSRKRTHSLLLSAPLLLIPALVYIAATGFGVSNIPFLTGVVIAGEAAGLWLMFRFWKDRRAVLVVVPLLVLAAGGWMLYDIFTRQADVGVYAILAQLYAVNAVFYWQDFRCRSIGVLTAVAGLVAWGAVFPCALLLYTFAPHFSVPGELWNLPKYFVEFGMILTLLEEQILQAEIQRKEYQLLFDDNPHPMWIFDQKTLDFLKVNEAAILQYGFPREEFLRKNLRALYLPEDVPRVEARLQDLGNGMLRSGPWTHVRKNGSHLQVEIASHGIRFVGRPARFSLVQDITERIQMHEQLVHQAYHDTLTGLPNRLLLKERMEQTLASAARLGHCVAVLCMDLDRFKQINDTYGHHVGDVCLQRLASRLQTRLRATDTVARSGGEEFTVLLGMLHGFADAAHVAQELLDSFRQPFLIEGYKLDLTASMGIALYPMHGTESQELWLLADTAMYRAKHSGGNQYIFVSNEISRRASETYEIEIGTRRALKEGGFEVHYQPLFSMDRRLYGFEALARLNLTAFGLRTGLQWVPPDRFIPIAEESGLILELGTRVLEEACRQSIAWRAAGLPQTRISVNVSPLQFMRADFSAQAKEILNTFGMDPSLLEIEVTETTMMRDLGEIARQMRELAGIGVRFSVDDFGTGYSSLRHLHQLPIHTLKIDRSFVERIGDPQGTFNIIQAIVSLAHSLEIQVVAEGVEEQAQIDLLASLGCDIIQGFFCGHPVPASDVPALLREGGALSDRAAQRFSR